MGGGVDAKEGKGVDDRRGDDWQEWRTASGFATER